MMSYNTFTLSPFLRFRFLNLPIDPRDIFSIVFPFNFTGSTFATGANLPNSPTLKFTSKILLNATSSVNLYATSKLAHEKLNWYAEYSDIDSLISTTWNAYKRNFNVR